MKTTGCILSTVLLLSAAALPAHAQDTLVVGTKNDGTQLKALCYTFPQRISDIALSEKGDYLCISFRETKKDQVKSKGELGFYDLANRQLLWKQPFKFTNQEIRALSEGVLTRHVLNNKVVLRGREGGLVRWKTNLYPVYLSDSLGIMMGYDGGPQSKALRAMSLRYGSNLWRLKVSHEHGWNEVAPLNNGVSLIVADDLHKIDFINGTLQTYEGKTGVHDTRAILFQSLAALAGVGLSIAVGGVGAYFVPTGNNVITGLTSNILVDDSCYFWADRNHIARLDTALHAIWQTPITDVKAATSRLFRQDDKLYMINYGFGMAGRSRRKYGRPFIACYDANSGEELFFNRLSTKKDQIEDVLRTDDALFLLFDDGMAYQSLTDSVVNITSWNTDDHGMLQGLLPPYCYVANEDTTAFELLVPEHGNCLVYTNRGEVFRVGTDLSISANYRAEQIYVPALTLQDYLCIVNDQREDVRFVHKTGMPVAHLGIPFRRGCVAGNKLILLNEENRLLFLDLDETL
ncbi:MAG: hypothetical protein LBL97_06700 [Prevotellaceae bacterium]|nr:hypothetical protein [Prevotellaceae bacterium]